MVNAAVCISDLEKRQPLITGKGYEIDDCYMAGHVENEKTEDQSDYKSKNKLIHFPRVSPHTRLGGENPGRQNFPKIS